MPPLSVVTFLPAIPSCRKADQSSGWKGPVAGGVEQDGEFLFSGVNAEKGGDVGAGGRHAGELAGLENDAIA